MLRLVQFVFLLIFALSAHTIVGGEEGGRGRGGGGGGAEEKNLSRQKRGDADQGEVSLWKRMHDQMLLIKLLLLL